MRGREGKGGAGPKYFGGLEPPLLIRFQFATEVQFSWCAVNRPLRRCPPIAGTGCPHGWACRSSIAGNPISREITTSASARGGTTDYDR